MSVFESPATKWLEERNVPFKRVYVKPGTVVDHETLAEYFSKEIGIPTSMLMKTIILDNPRDKTQHPVALIMPGDAMIDIDAFAQALGVRKMRLCRKERAHAYTGYEFGGTSPFGLAREADVKVYMEKSAVEMANHGPIWINGGGVGDIVEMNVDDLLKALNPTLVSVTSKQQN